MIELLLSLLTASALAAEQPRDTAFGVEPEAIGRVFVRHGAIQYLAEADLRQDVDQRRFRAVTLGAYYKLRRELRAGLFYKRQYGLRHDDDWVRDPANGDWG